MSVMQPNYPIPYYSRTSRFAVLPINESVWRRYEDEVFKDKAVAAIVKKYEEKEDRQDE